MYKRILLKLSGEALKGDIETAILDVEFIEKITKVIKTLHGKGIEIGVVIGAGNIWRGKLASEIGIDQAPADYMGMMGTVINAVAVSSSLRKAGVDTEVYSAISPIEGVTKAYDVEEAKKSLEEKKVTFLAGGTGKPFFTTDTAATKRAIELGCDAILMGKFGVRGIYDSDPRVNPAARFIKDIDYDRILEMSLSVMDKSAVELIKDTDIDIRVVSMNDLNNFIAVIDGKDIGTTCHRKGK